MDEKFREFEPHGWLRNGHLQTMAGAFLRRKFALPEGEERLFRADAETQLKGICHWQRAMAGSETRHGQSKDGPLQGDCRRDLPVLVIVHGLEGSCDSNYVLGIAEKAYQRGFHVVRLNQRNCGGTEKLTPTLYNSGMSGDYRAVFEELTENDGFTQIFFAGYSMGGNLVTKMAGEYGAAVPRALRGVCGICPAIDLAACADALGKRENYFYQRHFVNGLMARYARKAALFAKIYSREGFGKI